MTVLPALVEESPLPAPTPSVLSFASVGLTWPDGTGPSLGALTADELTRLGAASADGPVIVQEVTGAMSELPNLGDVDVKLVWSPAWSPDMMSEEARDELGIW